MRSQIGTFPAPESTGKDAAVAELDFEDRLLVADRIDSFRTRRVGAAYALLLKHILCILLTPPCRLGGFPPQRRSRVSDSSSKSRRSSTTSFRLGAEARPRPAVRDRQRYCRSSTELRSHALPSHHLLTGTASDTPLVPIGHQPTPAIDISAHPHAKVRIESALAPRSRRWSTSPPASTITTGRSIRSCARCSTPISTSC